MLYLVHILIYICFCIMILPYTLQDIKLIIGDINYIEFNGIT